jgi:hypothetical protein
MGIELWPAREDAPKACPTAPQSHAYLVDMVLEREAPYGRVFRDAVSRQDDVVRMRELLLAANQRLGWGGGGGEMPFIGSADCSSKRIKGTGCYMFWTIRTYL